MKNLEKTLKDYIVDLEFFLKDPEWDVMEYAIAMVRRNELLSQREKLSREEINKLREMEREFARRYRDYKVKYMDKGVEEAIEHFIKEITKHPF